MKLHAVATRIHFEMNRTIRLERTMEAVLRAFEEVDRPAPLLDRDLPALYRQLQERLAVAARMVRGSCQCERFGLDACSCSDREVH
jgi:hypothetical protein